ncbi:hypothetical protein QQS21_003926 [Conoideocrella luteorostrata]|uniref:Ketoreductase domain-containing protein n=1 Tax=Conoideocrella luteorostrata TaxID=1105319 RepID=A0AAJ0CSC5_9HYPO|nr:hypothetical protein QQS21_003926 [Conoideocrella luteorostrata]
MATVERPHKVVLVTGCTDGGAGAAMAREFHRRHHRVFATSTDGLKMQSLADAGITTLALDVTSQASIDQAASLVRDAAHGKIDMLINNAAVFNVMPLVDVDLENGRKLFDVNFFGVLAVIQTFLPLLMATDGPGLIANVSSMSATMCPAWQGMYAASKAALLAMGNILRVELAPFGVQVVTVMSGGVDTAGKQASKQQNAKVPHNSIYSPLAPYIETNDAGVRRKGMPPAEYAKQVVDSLLRPHPKPWIWKGAFAWLAWLLTCFGWMGMLDGVQIKAAHLDRIGMLNVDGHAKECSGFEVDKLKE